jgi:hypothetical protein
VTTPTTPSIHRPILFGLQAVKIFLTTAAVLMGYGLHRDEYLYLAEGSHPMWGYMEGPPMIGWVAGVSRLFLGSSVWAAKLPVLLVGLLCLYLLLKLVTELGGGKYAQLIAGAAWLLSPAYLGSNYLFQPVSFNQLAWLVIGLCLVRVVKYGRPKDWHLLGGVVGLALMTKYSVVFYLLALFAGLLLTPQRALLKKRKLWEAAGIALVIWLPNLLWQWYYEFPVVTHMEELARTQLVNMSTADFLVPQVLYHGGGLFVWAPGLYWFFRNEKLKPYRFLAVAFPVLVVLLLALSGKSYYMMGIYGSLMAAGGLFWEHVLKEKSWWFLIMFTGNLLLMPFSIPILPIEKMKAFGVYMRDQWSFSPPLRWEDGTVRDLRQDYADMHGWEEMVQTVAEFYHALPPEVQEKTMIYAGNYGQAGALSFFRKKYDLPEPYSFNASFILWVPEEAAPFDRQIAIEDYPWGPSEFFERTKEVTVQQSPFARETHHIYYLTGPTGDTQEAWKAVLHEQRRERLGMRKE